MTIHRNTAYSADYKENMLNYLSIINFAYKLEVAAKSLKFVPTDTLNLYSFLLSYPIISCSFASYKT